MDSTEILQHLFDLRDEKYRQFHSKLCPGTENIIGIRVPILRNYAKELKKAGVSPKDTGTGYYEEILLRGMLTGLAKYGSFDAFRDDIADFVPLIDNWGVCDVFCAGLKQTKKYKKEILPFLIPYLSSPNEFEVRFAVVMLLDYYTDDEYIDETLRLLKTAVHEGYYAKMAVAWALSAALVKYYDKTLLFMRENGFDKFIHNKAIQKARESYRIPDERKRKLLQYKTEI